MPVKAGLKDESVDNLVFGYDIGDTDLSYDGYPVENSVSKNATLSRYNNPGFSGYNRNTGRIHPDTDTPVWELAFYPQDEGRVPRLTSSEGYGCYHGMDRNLYAGTVYLASIMMKEGPGTRFIDNDMNHGYSNIGGWNTNGTTTTKEYVGNGWWRFYTIWNNGSTAYSEDGVTPLATRYSGNSYSTHELGAGEHIVSAEINPYAYIPGGTSNFRGNYQFSPYIINDYDSVGAQFLDWGLDEDMTKPVFNPVFNYPDPSANIRFFFKVNMPAPGSIRIRNRAYGVCEYLTDAKYWKIRFSDTALNKRELMWVTAPMIHEIPSTSYKKPWQYVDGVREGGLRSLVNNVELDLINTSKSSIEEGFEFDGTDDYITIPNFKVPVAQRSIELIVKTYATDNSSAQDHIFANSDQPGNGVDDAGVAILYRNNNFIGYIWGWADNLSPRTQLVFVTAPSTSNYYHLVLTHDNVTAKAYVNGELVSSASCIGSREPGNQTTLGSYSLGYSNRFQGEIPLVKVYNSVLSDEDILNKYNSTKSRFQ